MKFTKMQAFGNDYVYIDAIHQELKNLPELARFVSDRHFAIGSDGMVLICPSDKGDFRMRMFNPDGTEGEMCGNALRSVGKYVYDHRLTDKTELVIFEAARRTLLAMQGDEKLPSLKTLQAEQAQLFEEQERLYAERNRFKKEAKQIETINSSRSKIRHSILQSDLRFSL